MKKDAGGRRRGQDNRLISLPQFAGSRMHRCCARERSAHVLVNSTTDSAGSDPTGSDHSGSNRRHFHPSITTDRQRQPENFPKGLAKMAHGSKPPPNWPFTRIFTFPSFRAEMKLIGRLSSGAHVFCSRLGSLRKRQSVCSAISVCGLDRIKPTSCSRSAWKRSVSSGSASRQKLYDRRCITLSPIWKRGSYSLSERECAAYWGSAAQMSVALRIGERLESGFNRTWDVAGPAPDPRAPPGATAWLFPGRLRVVASARKVG